MRPLRLVTLGQLGGASSLALVTLGQLFLGTAVGGFVGGRACLALSAPSASIEVTCR